MGGGGWGEGRRLCEYHRDRYIALQGGRRLCQYYRDKYIELGGGGGGRGDDDFVSITENSI